MNATAVVRPNLTSQPLPASFTRLFAGAAHSLGMETAGVGGMEMQVMSAMTVTTASPLSIVQVRDNEGPHTKYHVPTDSFESSITNSAFVHAGVVTDLDIVMRSAGSTKTASWGGRIGCLLLQDDMLIHDHFLNAYRLLATRVIVSDVQMFHTTQKVKQPKALALLKRWLAESDASGQAAADLEKLKIALDEGRSSGRQLFP